MATAYPQESRADHTLARIARGWQSEPGGGRFVVALRDWLKSSRSTGTFSVYARAALDFFEWTETIYGTAPTPDRLTPADASAYERWLRERSIGLMQHRLDRDEDRKIDAAIHEIVSRRPGASIAEIRSALLGRPGLTRVATDPETGEVGPVLRVDLDCRGGLAGRLALLTRLRVLGRTPTIAELRRAMAAQAKASGEIPERFPGVHFDPGVFRYTTVPQPTPAGPARSCGTVTRIAALSSLWAYLGSPANVTGGEPLVRFNVWAQRSLVRGVREQARSYTVERRRIQTPDEALFRRLLALTYRRSHRGRELEAAEAAISGASLPGSDSRSTFAELRDRALLLVMLQAGGPRAAEVRAMRRRDLDLAAGVLTIHGKGGKVRTVPVPPPALDALRHMEARLRQLSEHQRRYGRRGRAFRLLGDDAPLLPAIRLWGANAGMPERGLTRQAILARLHELGGELGLARTDLVRLHPHGIRRLYANLDLSSGTPLHVVQAKMGHASGSTTLAYAEETDPKRLVSKAFSVVSAPMPSAQRPLPSREPPQLVEEPEPTTMVRPEPLPTVEELMREPPPVLQVERRRGAPLAEGPTSPIARPAREPSSYLTRVLNRPLSAEERAAISSCAVRPSDSGKRLCGIYAVQWGERGEGTRTRLGEPIREVEELERSTWGATGSAIRGGGGHKRVGQVYAGVESGLCWWAGTSGDLPFELPVPSPSQVGRCGPDERSELCGRLCALWEKWMAEGEESLGPSAAAALVAWLDEALELSSEVDGAILRRGGKWVQAEADWESTALGGTRRHRPPRVAVREHEVDAIVGWFEREAWQHRTSRAKPDPKGERLLKSKREPKVVTSPLRAPPWYGSPDPIAELPSSERAELLDFVSVLTGQGGLGDTEKRLGGRSRAELSEVVFALREYERALAEVRQMRHEEEPGPVREAALVEARSRAKDRLAAANEAFARLGKTVDVSGWVKERSRKRRSAVSGRESIASSHLALLGETFGPEVSADPIIRFAILASPERTEHGELSAPLGDYADLLRVDREKRTIAHTAAFKASWAAEHKTHSECVGRRMARELWELWREGRRGSGAFERRRELVDLVQSLAAYRIPCPGAQESELRELLGHPKEAIPIFEVWRSHSYEAERAEREPKPEPKLPPAFVRAREERAEREAELAEHIREETAESEYGSLFGGEERRVWNANPRGRFVPLHRRALYALPNPVRSLFAIRRLPA